MDDLFILLQQLGYWSWLIGAAVLVVLEIVAPGAVFLWLAIAAACVGGLVFFLPETDWKWQVAVFAVLSVVSIVLSRRYMKKNPEVTDHPTLNRRGQGHVGREFTLGQAIENGRGRIDLGDSSWRIEGPDLPAGRRIRVTAVDGATLKVEAAD